MVEGRIPGYELNAPTGSELRDNVQRLTKTSFESEWSSVCALAAVNPSTEALSMAQMQAIAEVLAAKQTILRVVGVSFKTRLSVYRTLSSLAGAMK